MNRLSLEKKDITNTLYDSHKTIENWESNVRNMQTEVIQLLLKSISF